HLVHCSVRLFTKERRRRGKTRHRSHLYNVRGRPQVCAAGRMRRKSWKNVTRINRRRVRFTHNAYGSPSGARRGDEHSAAGRLVMRRAIALGIGILLATSVNNVLACEGDVDAADSEPIQSTWPTLTLRSSTLVDPASSIVTITDPAIVA